MGAISKISWTHATFNGWIGCLEVSPACDNCYARTLAERYGWAKWGKDTERHRTSVSYWNQPLKWNAKAAKDGRRLRVFAFSLADVFEDRRDLDPWRADLWRLIEGTPNLDWMLLTKRADRVAAMLPQGWLDRPKPNVWLGVTAENQRRAEERIPALLEIPAAVHWISAEPLLGPIDFRPWFKGAHRDVGIDWVIVGGESGDGARRMDPEWARNILLQCRQFSAAYHFKQKGAVLSRELGCKDKAGKDPGEWPSELRVQEFPKVA